MVKCCICNVYSGTKEGLNLSFHSVPKKEKTRQQWKSILGTRFNEKGFVCSTHFSPDQFPNSINNRRQRILPEAVPSINLTSSWIASSASDSQENVTPAGLPKSDDHIKKEENITPTPETNSNITLKNEIAEEPPTSIVRDITSRYDFCQETVPDEPLQSESNNHQQLNRKRKCTFSDGIQSKNRTVKVLGDFKPEDFKNPSDYRVITKYLDKHKTESKVLKQKVRRLEKKVDTFKSLINDLKSQGLLPTDATSELNHKISPELQELYTRAMACKSNPYSPKLQEFATSLMFYSNTAYEYARTKLAALPHPETVRRWFRNNKFMPGISEPV